MSERIPVLYLAPWVGYGGSDKNTIDWFRWIDRERFAPYLITTQPSPNPLMHQVTPFAEEIWVLPDLMPAEQMPAFIFDFVSSRRIEVIHLMNSRLGFDLLPDLSCLREPPSVVVQLHVEEVDKSGYVRYVTTRYGNLVDRFSISNKHVAEAVLGYGVPAEKIEVIYTGVDAEEEFSPDRATPAEGLDRSRFQILYGARITDQKDPLLMVEVAAELRDRGVPFQIQVVGDGDLEDQVRAKVIELELADEVIFHPPAPGLRDWYAACDTLLLTSKFEGIPVVVFEAMAMGIPIVAPALPGVRELLDGESGLVPAGAPAYAYVEALALLAEDQNLRQAMGSEMRERARRHFSVREMAHLHEEVYVDLVANRECHDERLQPLPESLRFIDRPVLEKPLVSVLIPHYNQARFLRECVESVRAQSYPDVEIIVVDDASVEADAAATLDEIAGWDGVEVLRLPENGGPSRARNAGLERCRGRYVLPVDSDNLLLSDAIEHLVAQLASAGEEIGFIYPNLDFFGNRDEYHEAPPYNLYTLLHANFCDTCSLIDRTVFDAGLRYHEGIHLGHEDWEFALRLATYGVRGEAAHCPTIRYRKWGFNRSDSVDHVGDDFAEGFLAEQKLFEGREAEIKAREMPALSIVSLTAAGESDSAKLLAALAGQSCVDCELVADVTGTAAPGGPALRRFPAGEPAETLLRGLAAARGSFVALTAGTGADLLKQPDLVEKILRRLAGPGESVDGIAFADADGNFEFCALHEVPTVPAHTVVWRRATEDVLPFGLLADPAAPVGSVLRLLTGAGADVEWRHLSSGVDSPPAGRPDQSWIELPRRTDLRAGGRPPAPLLPGAGEYEVPRWKMTPTWIAPLSTIAIRYRERIGERRLIFPGNPPEYFKLEHFVGGLRSTGVQGTKKLISIDGTFRALPREEWRTVPKDAVEVGYLEEAPLPGLDPIALAVHRSTGEHLLVSLPDDPILHAVDVLEHLGFADPFPLRPRHVDVERSRIGLVGLAQTVDAAARRHRCGIGELPDGEVVLEVGGLAESYLQGCIPAWIVDGFFVTDRYRPPRRRPGAFATLRWSSEPMSGWGDLGSAPTRFKMIASRLVQSARCRRKLDGSSPDPQGDPSGWLFESARPGLLPLYASHHPVNGDQLLTRDPGDAAQLGYEDTQLLGFMAPAAPLTGTLDRHATSIPWARRAGHVPQTT